MGEMVGLTEGLASSRYALANGMLSSWLRQASCVSAKLRACELGMPLNVMPMLPRKVKSTPSHAMGAA